MNFRKLSFLLKARTIRRRSGRYLDELMATEKLSREQVLALQRRRAAEIMRFAAAHSPFQAERVRDAGVDLSRLEDPDVWRSIPIVDRRIVKDNTERNLTDEADDTTTREARTSGSTGEPLVVQQDARVPSLALAWRMYRSWGVEPWDDIARVSRWTFGRLDDLKNRLSWWPSRQIFLDASELDEAGLRAFHERVVTVRPRLIEGYLGAVLEYATFVQRHGLSVPGVTAIATTAAPLPPQTRERIESALGAPVYDEYRSSEVSWIAGECREQSGLHVFADARLIEIVDADGHPVPDGTVGDLVITDLTNRVFPTIRYRLGDRAALRAEPCPCGSPLPLMESVEGRAWDLIRLPSGRVLAQRLAALFGDHSSSVRLFQLHQLADYSIRVRVVLGEAPDAVANVESVAADLRRRIDDEVPVVVEYVDELPYTGGKVKYIISDVPIPD